MSAKTNQQSSKARAKVLNSEFTCKVVSTSDKFVEEGYQVSKRWQKILSKTIKQAEPIVDKQIDITFDTLEGIKEQLLYTRKRFSKLMGLKPTNIAAAVKGDSANTKSKVNKSRAAKPSAKLAAKPTASKSSSANTKIKSTKKDKLTIIEGIGPKIESLLFEGGIKTFEKLANTPVKKVSEILHNAGPRYKVHDPKTWGMQAKMAVEGQWDALKAWQDKNGKKK